MNAKYAKKADESVLNLVDKIDSKRRMEERGSYFNSISGLLIHIYGGIFYFLKLFKDAFENKNDILKGLEEIKIPESLKDDGTFAEFKKNFLVLGDMTISLIESMTEDELNGEIKTNWFRDRKTVPFYYLFNQLIATNIHHRGQLSQIFDEMKIENDFSGIDPDFITK
jgi:uncharacterized damage-inducible protein DinB